MLDTSTLAHGPAAFAAAHGLTYQPTSEPSGFGGALFENLRNAVVVDRFTAEGFEVGTITGAPGGSQTHRGATGATVTTSFSTSVRRSYGYLAIRLQRRLPHLVLDATRNDGLFGSSIPMPIANDQRLSLEGDFDRYFRLYCPEGYERDALYVFTPDLMALLIDETGDLDVEIVDDWFFVYSTKPLDLGRAATWERLLRIRLVVGEKAITRTDLYADERGAAATGAVVAEPGRRLTMGFLGVNPRKRTFLWLIGGFLAIDAVVITVVMLSLR